MYTPALTTTGAPKTFTVDCIGLINGKEYTYGRTFEDSTVAQRWATEEMKGEHTKRVACAELGFDVPGDFY